MIRNGFKSLVLAVGFATIIPVPSLTTVDDAALRRSMGFFPLAGGLLGLGLWGAMWAGTHLMPRFPAALAVVALYGLVTGGLHLDGLADTFDAFGSRHPPARALAVMKDSRIGTMGAVAVILVLMGKVIAFSYMPRGGPSPWVVVPVLARTAVVWSMAWVPAARPEGLGALFARRLSRGTVVGATILGLVAAFALLTWQLALFLMLLSVGATALWVRLIRRRLGGATGDTYGALLELVEWAGFLALTGGWGYGH